MFVSAQNNLERLLKKTGSLHGKELLARDQGERETNFFYISFVPFWILYHLYVAIFYKNKLLKSQKEVKF